MYVGVDIGGTKCAVTLADKSGAILQKLKFDTTSKDKTLKDISDAVRAMGEAEAIGISCGGPLDAEKGIILSPPNLPGWDCVPIVSLLEQQFGVKAYLQNDANACALAEWRFGAGEMCDSMIFLTFGTGMGAGLILNGRLYAGAGGNAGEIGHVRMEPYGPVGYGKSGSFEGFCSGNGIKQLGRLRATELLQAGKRPGFCESYEALDDISARSIAEWAGRGDRDAIEIYRSCGAYLGKGLSILVDVLNPQKIVLGSIYQRSVELLYDSMMDIMKRECLAVSLEACEILPSWLGDAIGDHAAVSVAISGKEGKGI